MVQKTSAPYTWYGHTSNTITGDQETVSVDVPGLEGYHLVPEEAEIFEEAYNLVTLNTEEDDFVFSFPHIVMFKLYGNRVNQPTHVLNYFFDTCGDYYAIKDAEILKENPPDMVIWSDLGNSAWTTHERTFRGGNLLGQREIQWWFSSVMETEYQLIGQSGTMFFYKRNGTPINYTYFENSAKKNSTAMPIGATTNPSWYFNGEGTQEDPYRIGSVEELIRFRDLVNEGVSFREKYLVQTANIDVSGLNNWEPIGVYGSNEYFYGIYDGAGYTISGVNVEREDNCGFFGVLGGTVKNLRLENGTVSGACVGGITSHGTGGDAKILNCYSNLTVSGVRAGGVADNFTGGEIAYCIFDGEVNGTSAAGGIVSYNAREIVCCQADDSIFAEENFTGTGYDNSTEERTLKEHALMMLEHAAQSDRDPFGLVVWNDEGRHEGYCSVQALFAGEGSKANPYLIQNEFDLELMRYLVNAGISTTDLYFRQTKDIDLSNIGEWVPIGRYGSGYYFDGTYDGNGHIIYGMTIKTTENCALFATLHGTVMNLGIEDFYIEGSCCGVIAGHGSADARIINCYAQNGFIRGGRTGAIVDNFSGTVVSCWSRNVTVETHSQKGDISSYSVGKIANCYGFEQLYPAATFTGRDYESRIVTDDAEGIKTLVEAINQYNSDIPAFYKLKPSQLVKLEVADGIIQFADNG